MDAREAGSGLLQMARFAREHGEHPERVRLALLVRLAESLASAHGRGVSFAGFSLADVVVEADGSLEVRRPAQEGDARADIVSLIEISRAIGPSSRPQDVEVTAEIDRALGRADSIPNLLEDLAAISRRHRLATDREYTRNLAERSLPEDPQFLATLRLPRITAKREGAKSEPPPHAEAWTGGSIRIPLPSSPPSTSSPAPVAPAPVDPTPAVVPQEPPSRTSTPTVRAAPPRRVSRLGLIGAAMAAIALLFVIATVASGRTLVVLLRMRPVQEAWFRSETLARFEETHGHRVRVETYRAETDVAQELERRAGIDVVKVEAVMLRPLAERGLLVPIDRLLTDTGRKDELAALLQTFEPVALDLARVPDTVGQPLYGAPRKVETQLLAFRKSRVAEARDQLDAFLPELEAELLKLTGGRLPKDYALEDDPNAWDLFDILTLGYVWSKIPGRGGRAPRLMFRSYTYLGTLVRLMDALAGSSIDGSPKLEVSTAMIDVFEWEALLRELDLLHPKMLSRDAIVTGREIDEAFARDEAFLTETHTLDLRLLRGGTNLPGYLADGSDLGFAVLPRRVSIALDNTGVPMRVGTRRAHVTGWVWAIPKSAPDPEESWNLISELVSRREATLESDAFWIQPARRDVALSREAADAVSRQMKENDGLLMPTFPSVTSFESFRDKLVGAWWDIVADRRYLADGQISRAKIKQLLKERL